MSTLSSSVSSIHRDNRSEARSYKRDKDRSSKWSAGARPGAGVKWNIIDGTMTTGSEEQQAKVRPEKKWSEISEIKCHANATKNSGWNMGHAGGRVCRKQDAMLEVASPATLSRSLIDLIPASTASNNRSKARTPAVAIGGSYYFEAPSPPRKVTVGLDSLVERAEKEFRSRETDKMVREEYEILDDAGETTVLAVKHNGKKGKKSPKVVPKVALPILVIDDEDDWERI